VLTKEEIVISDCNPGIEFSIPESEIFFNKKIVISGSCFEIRLRPIEIGHYFGIHNKLTSM